MSERLRDIVEPFQPNVSAPTLSVLFDIFILLCITSSCALLPLEYFYPAYTSTFDTLEWIFTAIFLIEYIVRWYAAESRWRYPFGGYAIIDLIALLPSLLTLTADLLALRVVRSFRLLRILRLLRPLRLLKFMRHGHLIYRVMVTLRISVSYFSERYRLVPIGRLVLWVLLALFIGANMLFLVETSIHDGDGPFQDYWRSYWHVVIVLISGIEDKEPISITGRLVVTFVMITGIVIIGRLTGEIVTMIDQRIKRAGMVALKPSHLDLNQHIIILGNNGHLDSVIRELHAAMRGQVYILVVAKDADHIRVTDPEVYARVFGLVGDPLQEHVLASINLEHALRVVIMSTERYKDEPLVMRDNRTLMEALAVAYRQPHPPIVVDLRSDESLRYARSLEDADIIVARHHGERLISQATLHPGITEVFYHLLSSAHETNNLYTVPVPVELANKTFLEAQLYFLDHDDEDITLIGIDRTPLHGHTHRLLFNPTAHLSASDQRLAPSDRLIIIADHLPAFAISREALWQGQVLSTY